MKSLELDSCVHPLHVTLLSWRENIKTQIWPLATLWRLSLRHYSFIYFLGEEGWVQFLFLFFSADLHLPGYLHSLDSSLLLVFMSVTKAWPSSVKEKSSDNLFSADLLPSSASWKMYSRNNSNVWVSKEVHTWVKDVYLKKATQSLRRSIFCLSMRLAPWIVK